MDGQFKVRPLSLASLSCWQALTHNNHLQVWDLRSFKCVQTFADENASGQSMTSFDHCAPLRRIVSVTKKLSAFDQGERQQTKVPARACCGCLDGKCTHTHTCATVEQATDEAPISAALFNSTSMTILTAAVRTVKVGVEGAPLPPRACQLPHTSHTLCLPASDLECSHWHTAAGVP